MRLKTVEDVARPTGHDTGRGIEILWVPIPNRAVTFSPSSTPLLSLVSGWWTQRLVPRMQGKCEAPCATCRCTLKISRRWKTRCSSKTRYTSTNVRYDSVGWITTLCRSWLITRKASRTVFHVSILYPKWDNQVSKLYKNKERSKQTGGRKRASGPV